MELLVVIVVIGILAAITIVSYTGINQKAIVSSLQSDLSNASKQLKIFSVEKGQFPSTVSTNCSSNPDTISNKCLKPSSNNTIELCSVTAQTFKLVAKNGSLVYVVTENSSPTVATVSTQIFSGGVDSGCYITHTFLPGTASITSNRSGDIEIDLKGGGGGGGACYSNNGGNGGDTVMQVITGNTYTAEGGEGGGTWETNWGGSDGITIANGLNGVTGGAINGGSGATACADGDGNGGGSGGRVYGSFNIASGKTVSITVGGGGNYNDYPYGNPGSGGGDGSITIRYPKY